MGENLDAILSGLKKKGLKVEPAATYSGIDIVRIPTGVFALDYALGGGFPIGRVNLITGKKGSGKSTVCEKTVANAQKMCRHCNRVHFHSLVESDIVDPRLFITELKKPKAEAMKLLRSSLPKEVRDAIDEMRPYEGEPDKEFLVGEAVLAAINSVLCANEEFHAPATLKKLKLELPKELEVLREASKEKANQWLVDTNRWVLFKSTEHLRCGYFRPMLCVWIDAEGVFEKKWAALHGIDLEELYLSRTETGEEAGDIMSAFLKSGEVDVIVVDSVAHLTPTVELEDGMEKMQVGRQAWMVNKISRSLVSAQNYCLRTFGRIPTMLMINQERSKVGIQYGDPIVNPGGMGLPFATSVGIKMWPGKTVMDSDLPLFQPINFDVQYNKVSTPKIGGEFKLLLADTKFKPKGDVWEEDQVLAMALKYGFLQQDGRTIEFYGRKFTKNDDLSQAWLEDKAFFEMFKKDFLSYMLGLL